LNARLLFKDVRYISGLVGHPLFNFFIGDYFNTCGLGVLLIDVSCGNNYDFLQFFFIAFKLNQLYRI
jgi:hypothetical protein